MHIIVNPKICYLCGEPITDKISYDHVPPQQFYPKTFRQKKTNIKLLKLPTHIKCNKSYQNDEDYFYSSIAVLSSTSPIGPEIITDFKRRTQSHKPSITLLIKSLNEFSSKYGSIYLPPTMISKKTDEIRIKRIIWKITRGLHYYHFQNYLPENISKEIIYLFPQMQKIPDGLNIVLMQKPMGKYGDYFDYKHIMNSEHGFQIWAFRFWMVTAAFVIFQYPKCECNKCKELSTKLKD